MTLPRRRSPSEGCSSEELEETVSETDLKLRRSHLSLPSSFNRCSPIQGRVESEQVVVSYDPLSPEEDDSDSSEVEAEEERPVV